MADKVYCDYCKHQRLSDRHHCYCLAEPIIKHAACHPYKVHSFCANRNEFNDCALFEWVWWKHALHKLTAWLEEREVGEIRCE